jgi:hypothetical protein
VELEEIVEVALIEQLPERGFDGPEDGESTPRVLDAVGSSQGKEMGSFARNKSMGEGLGGDSRAPREGGGLLMRGLRGELEGWRR